MDDDSKKIVQGLHKAAEAELAGYHFYLMAARSTEDEKGKEVFHTLADEEQEHFNFLKQQHNSFVATGKPDMNVRLGKPGDLAASSPIFSDRIRSRIQEAHYEMSALSIGIELELSSMTFYKNEAASARDQEVRAFFTQLADWEAGHYNALLRQQEELKQVYWAQGGFSPF